MLLQSLHLVKHYHKLQAELNQKVAATELSLRYASSLMTSLNKQKSQLIKLSKSNKSVRTIKYPPSLK